MVSRVDLLIAVIGIVVSVVGSSTAMWMTLLKKADKDDVVRLESRLESRMETGFTRLESRMDTMFGGLESRMDTAYGGINGRMDRLDGRMDRIENKLDALILRFLPDHLPDTGT